MSAHPAATFDPQRDPAAARPPLPAAVSSKQINVTVHECMCCICVWRKKKKNSERNTEEEGSLEGYDPFETSLTREISPLCVIRQHPLTDAQRAARVDNHTVISLGFILPWVQSETFSSYSCWSWIWRSGSFFFCFVLFFCLVYFFFLFRSKQKPSRETEQTEPRSIKRKKKRKKRNAVCAHDKVL